MIDDGLERSDSSLSELQLDLTSNQIQFAESMGVDVGSAESVESVMQQIERALGQQNIRELTRWFLMSVYRHGMKAKWNELADSGLSETAQQELVDQLVASDEFKQSILTVLKDVRCRYTLLSFGKTRNPANRSLANSTKAFKQARQVLRDADLIKSPGKKSAASAKKSPQASDGADKAHDMAASRRAARRGYSVQPLEQEPAWEQPPATKSAQDDQLSDEEFDELDKVLKEGGESSGQRFTYQTNEERLSLLLGVLAGFAACVVLLWVIY